MPDGSHEPDPNDREAIEAAEGELPGNRAARIGLAALVIGVVIALVGAGLDWWLDGRFFESTNDAYLQADQVTIAPKVQGYVMAVLVGDNQSVGVGEPLVRIDPQPYQVVLDQQQGAVAAREADVEAAARQMSQQGAAIDQAAAQLGGAQTTALYARGEAERYGRLSAEGVETAERAAQARNQSDQAAATARADGAALREVQAQAGALRAQSQQAQAQLDAAKAQAANARLNLADTVIRAGIAGTVGDRTVRVGQYVQPGMGLMTVVPLDRIYLVANFKETQVARMQPGQSVKIKVDALGGRVLDGVVDSFAPGTGSQFALLPAQNATGNFTKIVQRIPVRIRVVTPPDLRGRLVPGLSATVRVDIRSKGERPS